MLGEAGFQLCDSPFHLFQPRRPHLLVLTLWENKGHLPVIVTVEHNENAASAEAAHQTATRLLIPAELGQLEPQHVHWRRRLHRLDRGQMPYSGMPAVGAHCQQRSHLALCLARLIMDATN